MINDVTDELMEYAYDYVHKDITYQKMQEKIRVALARYAVAALMDSKIAIEAEQELIKDQ